MDITNYGIAYSRVAVGRNTDSILLGNSKSNLLTTQELQDLYKMGKDFRNQHYPDSPDKESLSGTYAIGLGAYSNDDSYFGSNDSLYDKDDALSKDDFRATYGLSRSHADKKNSGISINYGEGLNSVDESSLCSLIFSTLQDTLKIGGQRADQKYDESLYGELIKSKLDSSSYNVISNSRFKDSQIINQLIDELGIESHRYYIEAEPRQSQDQKIANSKYSQLFTDEEAFKNLLRTVNGVQSLKLQTADNMRFEIFESTGNKYVKTTLNGEAIGFAGSKNGIVELDAFLHTIDPKVFVGVVADDYTRKVNATSGTPSTRPVSSVRAVATEVERVTAPTTVVRTAPQVK